VIEILRPDPSEPTIVTSTLYQKADSYGSKSANGSWTGMVALVSRREADIGIADLTSTSERSNVVDFIDTVEFSR
jgi:hypothetical protein